MRLKFIKLAGFKSFVDPTVVKLPSNLCGVVGPNGCGKSNIIDAVRWVLGEASAKHLRGESMADVIFNGSVGRKPLGQASIELVFDNAEGKLGGEYASYTEIAIRRSVTRDGLSNYFLNGTRCRRRDIVDIFLGTGLGPRSYAIIEQGMISRLIEAKPDELRVYIEEAAGISKYKERRRDTENRIRRTRENLERLTDLREELERQIQHLKRQATAAERYTELRAEERRVKAELQALEWRALDRERGVVLQSIRHSETDLAAVHARHARVDADIAKARESHSEMNEILSTVQERYYALGAEIARIEQSVQSQQERARQLNIDLEQTQRSHAEAARHLEDDEASLARLGAELEDVLPALGQAETEEAENGDALREAEKEMQSWQSQWDAFSQAAEKPRQEVQVQQSRIKHLDEALEQALLRVQVLEREENELDTGALEQLCETENQRVVELETVKADCQAQVADLRTRIDARRQEIDSVGTELEELRGQVREHRGRLASWQALQQAALGQTNEAVTRWLNTSSLGDRPRLAEQLRVESGWEAAVEAVLGQNLQAVCVSDIGAAVVNLDQFREGMLTLFQQHEITGGSAVSATMLLSKVGGEVNVSGLLSGVLAVDRLDQGLALQTGLQAGESVVTRDGIWLGRDWLRVARDTDAEAGVLRRGRQIAALEGIIQVQRAREEELAAVVDEGRRALAEHERQMQALQEQLRSANVRYTEARARHSATTARLEQIALRRERNREEQLRHRDGIGRQRVEVQTARGLLETALEAMQRDNARRDELVRLRDTARTGLESLRHRAHHAREAVHQLALRRQSLGTRSDSLRAAIQRIQSQFTQLEQRAVALQQQIAATTEPIAAGRAQLEAQLRDRLQVEAELTAQRQQVQAIEHELREAERRRHDIEQEAAVARDELERLRLGLQTIDVRIETILEQLRRGDHEPEALLAGIGEDAIVGEWQTRLDRIGNQIQRLGPINLAAIDEHRAQSERKTYLDAQNADLVEALDTLENAIRKIDRETRTRFKDTFDRINNGLQELFPLVFGGGHAYLEMTGEDLLDTGVTIMARPPGKRNATIHLLSGGEKALTAISLVFSIFRLNPSPFCMLDEVDAPLDDANVGRFTRLVRDMADKVQFVVITHNKITMEMVHHLMGVTMQEPGVSRLVSVDVDEAVALAESA